MKRTDFFRRLHVTNCLLVCPLWCLPLAAQQLPHDDVEEAGKRLSTIWRLASNGNVDRLENLLSWESTADDLMYAGAYVEHGDFFEDPSGQNARDWGTYEDQTIAELKQVLAELLGRRQVREEFGRIRPCAVSGEDSGDRRSINIRVVLDSGISRPAVFRFSRAKDQILLSASTLLGEVAYAAFLARVFPKSARFREERWGPDYMGRRIPLRTWELMALDGDEEYLKRAVLVLAEVDWFEPWLIYAPAEIGRIRRKPSVAPARLASMFGEGNLLPRLKGVDPSLRMAMGCLLCQLGFEEGVELMLSGGKGILTPVPRGFWESLVPRAMVCVTADPLADDVNSEERLRKAAELLKATSFAERFQLAQAKVQDLGMDSPDVRSKWLSVCEIAAGKGISSAVRQWSVTFAEALPEEEQDPLTLERIDAVKLVFYGTFKDAVSESELRMCGFYPVVASTGGSKGMYDRLFSLCVKSLELDLRAWSFVQLREFGAPRVGYLGFAQESLRAEAVGRWRSWLAAEDVKP